MPFNLCRSSSDQPLALQARFEAAIHRMNVIAESLPDEKKQELRKQIVLAELAHCGLIPHYLLNV